MLRNSVVEVSFVPKFSKLQGVNIRQNEKKPVVTGEPPAPQGSMVSHLVLVTGQPSSVLAFERALDLFYANIPQVEISVQVIESSTADALAIGVESLTAGDQTLTNLNSKQLVQGFTADFPIRQPLVGANPVTDAGTFALGGIHKRVGARSADQGPRVEEPGQREELATSRGAQRRAGDDQHVHGLPVPQGADLDQRRQHHLGHPVQARGRRDENIHPTIAGTQTVILQLSASVSAVTGFAQTPPVDTPIISDRSTTTTVHVNHNESVVIGGLVAESTFESETKVPILGDIPILGYLFRSTSENTSRTELIFVITPKIVRASDIRYEEAGF